ncbi:MAG: hypothetical protein DRP78_02400 [Candidatus Omnitrophota bacterium]|nr:MAG: hypothetical protein DRP78_02400 [Candidatus Omnitrophota bacterium]
MKNVLRCSTGKCHKITNQLRLSINKKGMVEMAKLEYKSIMIKSVFKLCGSLWLVLGFIIALFGNGVHIKIANYFFKTMLHLNLNIGSLFAGFLGALWFAVFSGIIGGLFFVLLAVLYNAFAVFSGGIEIDTFEQKK